MKEIAHELNVIIDQHLAGLQRVPENEYTFKSEPKRWSKKEILGHLVDSAQNNIRRFVMAQYEQSPKIVYNQDRWVAIADYQHYDLPDLISFWYLNNKHICRLLATMNEDASKRDCETEASHSIEWLATDYLKHLRHHLHQILDLDPVAYP